MALGFSTKQFSALGFAAVGGAMTGLAAGIASKSCAPGASAGGRALSGVVIGALVGTVSALLPVMLLYGSSESDATVTGLGLYRGKWGSHRAFRYSV